MIHQTCPFCKSSKLSIELLYPAWGGNEKEAHIVCDDCASSYPEYVWKLKESIKQNGKVLAE